MEEALLEEGLSARAGDSADDTSGWWRDRCRCGGGRRRGGLKIMICIRRKMNNTNDDIRYIRSL